MNRIAATFQACRDGNRKALVMFVSAGDPSLPVTERLIDAIIAAGADLIEIGVPFSDPMADGPAIQAASQRALASGTTLRKILDLCARVRTRTQTPLILFSYYNVILQYGVHDLARDAAAAGIDGWLLVDVPAEEADEVRPAMTAQGLQWITLLAPTTPPERAARLAAQAEGFVYYITVTGVTGVRAELPDDLATHLEHVREIARVPVVAGFGISNPEMARRVAAHADGVVVGSALVNTLARAAAPEQGISACAELVRALAAALK